MLGVAMLVACGSKSEPQDPTSGSSTATTVSVPTAGETEGSDTGPGSADDTASTGSSPNSPPVIERPDDAVLAERESWSVTVSVSDPDGDDLRLFALDLPPGAQWSEDERTLSFRPDFTQGADDAEWSVTFVADDGEARSEASMSIAVEDTVTPPWPTVIGSEPGDGFTWLYLQQTTDDFLDSPGYAGRSFDAIVSRPDDVPEGERRPVLILLHGFDGTPPMSGWQGEYRIMPHDPDGTYWWGYGEALPGGSPGDGSVPPYTQRRVLHLLEWVLRNEPGADPQRVAIMGDSMGGAGAATIGLLHGRHFAAVDASIFQAIPRNHRPSRIAQLSGLWGSPDQDLDDGDGMIAWDRQDLTRALLDEAEARGPWSFSHHGKDDPTIHFGAVTIASPLTGLTYYEALQQAGAPHLAVWDEGAHGPADPVLGEDWWQQGWNPIYDATAFVRRDQARPGLSAAEHDGDPGSGRGNGQQPWSDESGYAGDVTIPGDTGWDGELAGALNRFLRWDAGGLVDTIDRFELPLRVLDGEGGDPPLPGYPTTGDRYDGPLPLAVDVSLRRVQAFRCRAGEEVDWQLGELGGQAIADEAGELTIPAVPLDTTWQTLVVTRRQ